MLYGHLISQRRGSTTNWFHFDALGSTELLTGTGGSPVDRYRYEPFGAERDPGSTAGSNPFRFVGKLG